MLRRQKIRVTAITIGLALCALSLRWQLVSAVATILLLYVTFEYLLVTRDNLDVTQENLKVLKSQIQRQQQVVLHFDFACRTRTLWLRVSNLGISNFLVRTVHFRKPDKTEFIHEIYKIVQTGKIEEVQMPSELYKDEGMDVDLEVTLEYLGQDGEGKTAPKCFNVSLDFHDLPIEVSEELSDAWYTHCPKCKAPCQTNVYGLKTFEAAEARRARLTEQLRVSCPNHNSEWLLTVEDVRAHNEERKNLKPLPDP
jgi:hypothetical protein